MDIQPKLMSVKIICIKRLSDDNFHSWKIIPNKLFSFCVLSKFQTLKYCIERFSRFPKCYHQLILFWENVCIEQPNDFQDIINQSIWNDKFTLREMIQYVILLCTGKVYFLLEIC